ncbi:MerR family DNA-binding protein [Microcoleus sp. D2_18a_B4]|uniref:MerR family DNA-binding protein n=1 Tax=Microcoleus sp. D2_18a_B4 TaxID=3055329 RepID=UPI002FD1EE60
MLFPGEVLKNRSLGTILGSCLASTIVTKFDELTLHPVASTNLNFSPYTLYLDIGYSISIIGCNGDNTNVPIGRSLSSFRTQSTNSILYFYKRIGLSPSPQRTEAGDRLFSRQDMERLAFISSAKSLGLSLEEIKEVLALEDGQLLTCQAVDDRLNKKAQAIEDNIPQ